MSDPTKIKIDESVFQKHPDLAKRMGGHQLPTQYLDVDGDFFPEAKEKEGIIYPKEGGMLSCYKIYRFPTKGIPVAPALECMNTVKKMLRESLGILAIKPIRYFLPLILLLPKKTRKRIMLDILTRFVDTAEWILGFYLLKPGAMCTAVREIYFKIKNYIDGHYEGRENSLYTRLLVILCHLPELDSAYRYRMQDWATIVDKEALKKNTAQELKRVFGEAMYRERAGGQKGKFDSAFTLLKILFFFRRLLKKKFIEIIDLIDLSGESFEDLEKMIGVTIEKNQYGEIIGNDHSTINTENLPYCSPKSRVGLDHADWYHCLNAPNYDFGGIPFNHRLKLRKAIDVDWVKILTKRGAIKPQ